MIDCDVAGSSDRCVYKVPHGNVDLLCAHWLEASGWAIIGQNWSSNMSDIIS